METPSQLGARVLMKITARALSLMARAALASSLLFVVFGLVVLLLLLESGVLTPRILSAANRYLGPATALRVNAESVRWRPWSGLTLANAEVRSILVPLQSRDSTSTHGAECRLCSPWKASKWAMRFLESLPRHRASIASSWSDPPSIWRRSSAGTRAVRSLPGLPDDSGSAGRRGGLVIREFGIDNGTFLGESGWKLSGIKMHGSLLGAKDPWILDIDDLVMRIRHGLIDESLSGKGVLNFARSAVVVDAIDIDSQAGALHLSGVVVPPEDEGSSIAIEGSAVAIDKVAAWFGVKSPAPARKR